MSHFTALVITDEKPSQDDIGLILQPWHEFECTGEDDQYVQEIDVTAETKDDHAKHGEGQPLLTFAMGWLGLEGKTVASREELDLSGPHKYGFILAPEGDDPKIFDRTNPDKKWDWWKLGGRWSGLMIPLSRDGTDKGEPGLMGMQTSAEGVDICRVDNLDKATMQAEERFPTFAVIKDGQWYERGRMGWWGCVSDEKDEDVWDREFGALIDGLPETAWLTVVDCHI